MEQFKSAFNLMISNFISKIQNGGSFGQQGIIISLEVDDVSTLNAGSIETFLKQNKYLINNLK